MTTEGANLRSKGGGLTRPPDNYEVVKNTQEEFPTLPGAASAAPATSGTAPAVPSYSERLKSNVKYDQRLKRNVLEICLEKTEKDAEVVINGDTIARVLRSLRMNIETELEGAQIQYGRMPIIHVWCKPEVKLEKFCNNVGIIVSNGLSTGHIRPAGRRDVMVTIQGLNFNTPDGLVMEYIRKFGGELVSQDVVYRKYREGLLAGKYTGDRQYKVEFGDSSKKMGTFHYLDGAKIKIFYKGNLFTCGRCHRGRNSCKGEAIAKTCMEKGGQRVSLFDHMRTLWSQIDFHPTSFKLPEQEEESGETDTGERKDGDKEIVEISTIPATVIPNVIEENPEKFVGLGINNLPPDITDSEILKFLKDEVHEDLEMVNYNILRPDATRNGTKVEIFSGLSGATICAAYRKLDSNVNPEKKTRIYWPQYKQLPVYLTRRKNLTPPPKQPGRKIHDDQKETLEEHLVMDEVKAVSGSDSQEEDIKQIAGNALGMKQPNINSFFHPAQTKPDTIRTPVQKDQKSMEALEEHLTIGKVVGISPTELSPDTNRLLGHKLNFESEEFAENAGETHALDEFDFEEEQHNGKEGESPTLKETEINVKKRPLNSPAESTLEPKTAKTSQSQLPVKQRKNNH